MEKPLNNFGGKSDRILFDLPFMHFWFLMVSPNYQSIVESDYDEFAQKWYKLRENFSILLSDLLILELAKERFNTKQAKDPIIKIGSYYDKKIEIDILAIKKYGAMIAGVCKYSKEPAKTNMMDTLIQKCAKAELEIEDYVLFSKNGFTSELEALREKEVVLLSNAELSSLLDNLSENDLPTYKNKKY